MYTKYFINYNYMIYLNNLIIISTILFFIFLFTCVLFYHKTETFIPNYNNYEIHVSTPLTHNYGYSNIDDPLLTAHPIKMIDANLPDKLIKHIRLNNTGNPMYWTYNPPNSNIFNKVDCPYNVVDVTNKNNPNSRYNLICWTLK